MLRRWGLRQGWQQGGSSPAGEGWGESSSSTHTIGIRAPFRSRAVAVLSLLRATPLAILSSRRRAAPLRAMP